jgi:hypothetical protein
MTERVLGLPSCDLGLDDRWQLVTEYDSLRDLLEHLGVNEAKDEITGAFVLVGDGDYDGVYLTDSSKPWSIYARWYDLDYFADVVDEELDLQD